MRGNYKCQLCASTGFNTLVQDMKDWEYGYEGVYEYRKCLKCSMVQIHPFPELSDLMEAYKIDYHGYTAPSAKGLIYAVLFGIVEWMKARELEKMDREKTRVLDVGCGIGLLLKKMRALGFQHVEGIDFSETAVRNVRASDISCHLGTFLEWEKEPGSYDLIVMNNYLEHTIQPLEELKKARDLLEEGGVLMGEVPNFGSFERYIFGRYWGGNHVPRHTFQFDAGRIRKILDEAGFRRSKIRCTLNTSHLALSLQNYFQRKCRDLRNNPNLSHGRDRYYSMYMVGLLPLNAVLALWGRSGFMRFWAWR
jgi:2-polyprenyl-3-methyl-5-hydroxy-6-metoxy-1,4-benzoquinol methylase